MDVILDLLILLGFLTPLDGVRYYLDDEVGSQLNRLN